jgi:hypothetical protein
MIVLRLSAVRALVTERSDQHREQNYQYDAAEEHGPVDRV